MSAVGLTGTEWRRLSLQQKIALAGGAVAGVAVAPSAEAGIVQSTTLPLSPPATYGSNFWDVDGDGTNDFRLLNTTAFAKLTELGAARFVAPSDVSDFGFAKLDPGFTVGPTMAGFKFSEDARSLIPITHDGGEAGNLSPNGWSLGNVGYFGFKFTNASGVHYGWGEASIHGATGGFNVGQGYTLTQAYYNTTPDATIQVGVVPEPALAGPAGVCALVMGSLAMLERRRRRQGATADATAVSA